MNRQEKINKIYEVIADKTLSFGCLMRKENGEVRMLREIYNDQIGEIIQFISGTGVYTHNLHKFVIIGHKVMIGDVMDYIEMRVLDCFDEQIRHLIETEDPNLLELRTKKRLPISEQSDDCIDYVYSILPQDATNG